MSDDNNEQNKNEQPEEEGGDDCFVDIEEPDEAEDFVTFLILIFSFFRKISE